MDAVVGINPESIFTNAESICENGEKTAWRSVGKLALLICGGGAFYGATMGLGHPGHPALQSLVSAVKVPALFATTLLVTLPSLHFMGLFFGTRTPIRITTLVLMTGTSVTTVLLAAFAPIAMFFLLSGSNYEFMMLLHVFVFSICGMAGLKTVVTVFRKLRETEAHSLPTRLLHVWLFLYMLVGTQMAFNLSPFVDRGADFELFRRPDGNFYTYVLRIIDREFFQIGF